MVFKLNNMDELKIEGVVFSPLNQIGDERGSVLHMIRNDSPEFTTFGECYFSEVFPGKVKAWKKHRLQTQNIAVPVGRVRLVLFDPREKSSTFGNLIEIELGRPDAYNRVQLPPGIWYGFGCISQSPALIVNCADMPHLKNESETLDLNSTAIPFNWFSTSELA
jgi:dTDP-4-dehydrorhamnose 3,5-epimerase